MCIVYQLPIMLYNVYLLYVSAERWKSIRKNRFHILRFE